MREAARENPPGAASEAQVLRLQTTRDRAAALAAVASKVEDWNGEWTAAGNGGDLRLPVEAGLRRGFVRGHVTATTTAGGSELALEIVEARWWIHRVAVALLIGAAVPAMAGVLWPFVPAVAPLVPLGLVLGAASWLAILARLRHRGPAEFLADVESTLEQPNGGDEESSAEKPPPIAPR